MMILMEVCWGGGDLSSFAFPPARPMLPTKSELVVRCSQMCPPEANQLSLKVWSPLSGVGYGHSHGTRHGKDIGHVIESGMAPYSRSDSGGKTVGQLNQSCSRGCARATSNSTLALCPQASLQGGKYKTARAASGNTPERVLFQIQANISTSVRAATPRLRRRGHQNLSTAGLHLLLFGECCELCSVSACVGPSCAGN